MHEHTEKTCRHELKVCADCGDVYCSKCKREWYKEQWKYSYAPTRYVGISNPNTVTWTDTITSNTTHVHS